ncbi:ADP-ribosylglycohydrolase family protein [Occultella glacieicola]|uniref:ADP-ribosylglycohydrolase family protein n=1 Tax=Occultella glacieicola TaxID=2518684 RepID=A0ABY2EC04_9MICO|nr:ADP-ribosylglycohydrolase family protein [Occultella glacieicola]TDE98697.1 ADP-ribosylglycohydrolase family protein [Occultella glacieicola]
MTDAAERRPDRAGAADYRRRMLACWRGKAVGGTLGQTFEGLEGPLTASFYHPVPTEMVPNDDLDLQVLFACVLAAQATPRVDRLVLARAWADHVLFPWNEYGVGMRNLAEGLLPPETGSFDNWFTCGEGAAIRTELWACLAPGDPDLAGRYAYEDACFDHAGDGVTVAVFLARLASAAFGEPEADPHRLLDVALDGIDPATGIARVVADTRRWHAEGLGWQAVRERIVDAYANSDFTDVRPNTGFVVLGWLAGSDFSERILITNNCGGDTDSSTATLGALLAIIDPDAIDDRWLGPIGDDLVLNPEIRGISAPPTISAFADLVDGLRVRLNGAPPPDPGEPVTRGVGLTVRRAWVNTNFESWAGRDLTGLPHAGAPLPDFGVEATDAMLPGTWVRLPREEFEDVILLLHYPLDGRGRDRVRIMVNGTEHFRAWLDGEYLFGAPGTQAMFPAPHSSQIGHAVDLDLPPGEHTLSLALRRPPASRPVAEWVVGVAELPSCLWIPNALRRTP